MKSENYHHHHGNGTPSLLWPSSGAICSPSSASSSSASSTTRLSNRFSFDEKKLAELQKHDITMFPSPPAQHPLYDKRNKSDMTSSTTTGFVSSTSPHNENIYDSLSLGLYPSQSEHLVSIQDPISIYSNSIYPTPPPSTPWYGHFFNDSF